MPHVEKDYYMVQVYFQEQERFIIQAAETPQVANDCIYIRGAGEQGTFFIFPVHAVTQIRAYPLPKKDAQS